MSGGPYGRGKAPERACMKEADWPAVDRHLWMRACAPADLLDDETGARAGHREISNRKAEKGYGRWLTFLANADPSAMALAPADRITPERVRAYVDALLALNNSTATILARLQELGEVAIVVGPERDWRFIKTLASKIRARHRPARDKANLRLSDELLDLGFQLMDRAKQQAGLSAAISHRDGLMIALLALAPLRRRNFARLRLGESLVEVNGGWVVLLDENDTKTHARHEVLWPQELLDPLAVYLDTHRPLLASLRGRWSQPIDDALWVSSDGSPMTEMAIYDRISKRTREAFGAPINPHLFRDAAATTLAVCDPAHVRVAAPLLGHRTFSTTEKYYQQATAMEAHRHYIDALFGKDEK